MNVKRSVTINRPASELYEFWRNFEQLPQFMYHLEHVEVIDARKSHWVAKAPAGEHVEWDAIISDDVPNERISWRSVEGGDVKNSGTVRFTEAPGDRGTEVHVDLSYEPPAGKAGALIAKLFGEEPGQQMRDDLRRLKQICETGEVVLSDAAPEGIGEGVIRQHPSQPSGERRLGTAPSAGDARPSL